MAKTTGCWASALNDCEGSLTHEHIVSVNAFAPPAGEPDTRKARTSKHVRVGRVGSSFERHGFVTSVNNLTAKVLCKRHNELLSDTDEAAGALSRAIDDWAALVADRARYPTMKWAPRTFDVDGPRLERWFMKSVITTAADFGEPVGSAGAEPGCASLELAEIVFGRRPIDRQTGTGLSQLAVQGEKARVGEEFGFAHLADLDNGCVTGGLVIFKPFAFAVQFGTQRLEPSNFRRRWVHGDLLHGWKLDRVEVVQPPRTITSGSSRAVVELHWPEDPRRVETILR